MLEDVVSAEVDSEGHRTRIAGTDGTDGTDRDGRLMMDGWMDG